MVPIIIFFFCLKLSRTLLNLSTSQIDFENLKNLQQWNPIRSNPAMPSDKLRKVFSRMRSRSTEKERESANEPTYDSANTEFNGLKILYDGDNATIE
jgi:hypothetical protein